MGLKGAGSITNRDGPGPGDYNYKTAFERIKGAATFGKFVRIGKGKRNKDDGLSKSMAEFPGPGAYNGNFKTVTRNSPKQVFGTANRDKNTFYDTGAKNVPGPGTYPQNGLMGRDGKSVTISPRRPDTSP